MNRTTDAQLYQVHPLAERYLLRGTVGMRTQTLLDDIEDEEQGRRQLGRARNDNPGLTIRLVRRSLFILEEELDD